MGQFGLEWPSGCLLSNPQLTAVSAVRPEQDAQGFT